MACAPTSGGTSVSTGPEMRTDGDDARARRRLGRGVQQPAAQAVRRRRRRSCAGRRSPCGSRARWCPDPRPPAGCAAASTGSGERRSVLCSCRPVANSRWMTWSCRSRAIRSRSANTSSWRCARFFSPSSSASVACSANEVSSGTSAGWNGWSSRVAQGDKHADHRVLGLQRHRDDRAERRLAPALSISSPAVVSRISADPPVDDLAQQRVAGLDPLLAEDVLVRPRRARRR